MDKLELRKSIQSIAAGLSDTYISEAGLAIQNKIISSELFRSCNSVFIYVNTAKEPGTWTILENAWASGKAVYVPKCYPNSVMKAVRVRCREDLAPGMLGILEPVNDSETEIADNIDLAIIPCVAASTLGARLGHGCGYYDRFLQGKKIKKVCLCFEKLLCSQIPMDQYDTWMDAVVTESDENILM